MEVGEDLRTIGRKGKSEARRKIQRKQGTTDGKEGRREEKKEGTGDRDWRKEG